MLWTDRQFITTENLVNHDQDIAQVEKDEKLLLEGPSGLIRRSISASGSKLVRSAKSFGVGRIGVGNEVSVDHLRAVLGASFASSAAMFDLSQVVIDDPLRPGLDSPLRIWTTLRALRDVYEDAVSRRVKDDRYADRVLLLNGKIERAWLDVAASGVPVVLSPLSQPGAEFMPETGDFDSSDITPDSGGAFSAGDYRVAITYIGESYVSHAARNQSESAATQPINVTVTSNQRVTISIARLLQVEPMSVGGFASGYIPWTTPTGWNVYLGTSGALYKQNATPIPIATTSHELQSETLAGDTLLPGQYPDERVLLTMNVLQMG